MLTNDSTVKETDWPTSQKRAADLHQGVKRMSESDIAYGGSIKGGRFSLATRIIARKMNKRRDVIVQDSIWTSCECCIGLTRQYSNAACRCQSCVALPWRPATPARLAKFTTAATRALLCRAVRGVNERRRRRRWMRAARVRIESAATCFALLSVLPPAVALRSADCARRVTADNMVVTRQGQGVRYLIRWTYGSGNEMTMNERSRHRRPIGCTIRERKQAVSEALIPIYLFTRLALINTARCLLSGRNIHTRLASSRQDLSSTRAEESK
ncbi:hypothetical protein CBL_14019 [Carabus blaptoides fortunei]